MTCLEIGAELNPHINAVSEEKLEVAAASSHADEEGHCEPQ